MTHTDSPESNDANYKTYLRNFALALAEHSCSEFPDVSRDDSRTVAAAALGIAAGRAGKTTPLPRQAFLEVLDEYVRQPWTLR